MSNEENLRSSLKPEFVRASMNIASKSLNNWGKWNDAEGFPEQGTWEEKLLFVDKALETALQPIQHRPNERMFWRTRPDLNKYRGWLLNRTLQHQMSVQDGNPNGNFILPEDLPKLADDLYLFHKHHKAIGRKHGKDAGTLQHYKSLAELNEAISPYEASYPLNTVERSRAHAKFIREDGGNGDAVRIAALKDGTEVIQVLTEDASRAYGSPRWCTAYQNQPTYFDHYKDDLLIVIEPDGQRWQFHFRTNQLHDENDDSIEDISGFLNYREELAAVLTPYWEKGVTAEIEYAKERWHYRDGMNLLALALSSSAFKSHALQRDGFLDTALQDLRFDRKSDNKNVLLSVAKQLKDDPEFQPFLEPHIFDRGIAAFNEEIGEPKDDYFSARNMEDLWEIILEVPAWKTRAIKEGHLNTALETLLNSDSDNALSTFIELAKKHSQDQDVREAITPLLFVRAFEVFHENTANETASITRTYMSFYRLVMSDPEWKDMALEKGINEKALPLLDKTFASYNPETGIYEGTSEPIQRDYLDFCNLIRHIPEWEAHAKEQGHFAKAVSDGHLSRYFDKYEGHARDNKFFGTTSRDYIKYFWASVLAVPEWRQHAQTENRLGRMLDILFDEDLKPKRGLGFYSNRDKNDPAKTFMYMMREFYNRPGFRESMTPHITDALALGKGEEASFKLPFSGRRAYVNITGEILKYAGRCREWRDQITTDTIEAALQDDGALPSVIAIAAGGQVSHHWKKAVIDSHAVPEFLKSESSYRTDPVKEIIAAHPQFHAAFGQHL